MRVWHKVCTEEESNAIISIGDQFFNWVFTAVWNFNDFSFTQILRETNFGDSRNAKSANEFLQFLEADAEIY